MLEIWLAESFVYLYPREPMSRSSRGSSRVQIATINVSSVYGAINLPTPESGSVMDHRIIRSGLLLVRGNAEAGSRIAPCRARNSTLA